jgi:hypothetical protein
MTDPNKQSPELVAAVKQTSVYIFRIYETSTGKKVLEEVSLKPRYTVKTKLLQPSTEYKVTIGVKELRTGVEVPEALSETFVTDSDERVIEGFRPPRP